MCDETDWLAEARKIAKKVRRTYPGVDYDDAIDAAHVAVARLLNEFDPSRGESPLAHVRSLGVRRAADELREMGAVRRADQPDRPEEIPTADIDETNHTDLGSTLRFSELANHPCLFPDERRVLHLRYGEGLSFEAIGERLGLAEGTAWARHKRAISRLREVLGPDL